ncbi:NAD(P)-dependent oxidoreductase [Ramlibacter alkalitolerans]|uniref:Hydroxyacid dehydrogenase n=1 Tax=Ramlibacter alkalitolerans TaxID=2039631 RepID=A0ABS1JR57_9BURK|nr:hydroxyacid dehydrogenase [Ramlibacter alkalitolerans]MBL0426636.1 hydroxyacid dehydrogenase [Ramlibacter alkalitolerans]
MPLPHVLLTNPIDPAVSAELARHAEVRIASALDAETLRREVRDADYLVVRAPLPEDIFEYAPRMRAAVRHGAGLDMIPLAQASRHGVAVANVPGVNALTVAEYAVGQMLNLARHLPRIDHTLRAQGWGAARQLSDGATDLGGKTLAVVGMGSIGHALARICAAGFGMRVLGVRRTPAQDTELVRYVSLQQALPEADYVVLACPLTEQTRGLIGAAEFAQLKPGARLVNVARGPVVDEPALTEALRSGRLAGAALDVFATQPLPADSPLRALPNVLLSPHLAGMTRESTRRMGEGVLAQLRAMFRGALPEHLCNPQARDAILARWAATIQP